MLTAIGDVMRRVYERGWITTRDGNISMRSTRGSISTLPPLAGGRPLCIRSMSCG